MHCVIALMVLTEVHKMCVIVALAQACAREYWQCAAVL
jgi:hypothetical protein